VNYKHFRKTLIDSDESLNKGVRSPSKHIPLARLKQLKQDNYVGANRKDYSQEELDQAIVNRSVSHATKAVKEAGRKEKQMANEIERGTGSSPEDFPFLKNPFKKEELQKGLSPDELKNQGYRFTILKPTKSRDNFAVRAYHGKKAVGHLVFSSRENMSPENSDRSQRRGYHSVTNGHIDDNHRNQGLYQHMLKLAGAHAKSIGSKGVYSEGNQRSGAATKAWDKVATHAARNPFTLKEYPTKSDNADYFLAAGELEKGVARRLYGKFNPEKELGEDRSIQNWISGSAGDDYGITSKARASIPEPSDNAKLRMLNKLRSRAKTRFNPQTKQNEYLLHRQMSQWEKDSVVSGNRVNHKNKDHSSWTPFLDSITQSSGIYSKDSGKHKDQWHWQKLQTSVPDKKLAASEGELEKGAKGDWKKEGYSLKFHPPKVEMFNGKHDITSHRVTAHDSQGNRVGDYYFSEWPEASEHRGLLHVTFSGTDPDHQRKGLASAAYSEIEKRTGKKLNSAVGNRSADAKALWSQPNRPFGKSTSFKLSRLFAPAIAGAIAASPQQTSQMTQQPTQIEARQQAPAKPKIDKNKFMAAVAEVESNHGKYTDHAETPQGKAYGVYGLMPNTIKDTVVKNPKFKNHRHIINMDNDQLHEYMVKNPDLQKEVASAHFDRLKAKFGEDLAALGHSWLNGVTGTLRAQKQGKDIENHWHVQKIRRSYSGKP
jgi:GNAT superfamily N-acetyltransferase